MIQTFCTIKEKFYFSHVISSDLRAKITLTGVIYRNPQEALKSTLSDMTMLILLPNDQKLANVLLKHVKTQVQRSKNKSAALVLLSSTENNEYLLSDFHYVGEEPLNLKYKDSPQIVRLWRLGNFLKYRPLFGGKETDSDDDTAVPSFVKLPPCFSLEELKHMNQYAELKPAYDFLSSGGVNTRDLTHASCFVSLHPEAPHPIL